MRFRPVGEAATRAKAAERVSRNSFMAVKKLILLVGATGFYTIFEKIFIDKASYYQSTMKSYLTHT